MDVTEECIDAVARRSCIEDGCDTLAADESALTKDGGECSNGKSILP